MRKLDWVPVYIDDLLSSPAWQDMRDYQRGWYFQLLLRMTRGERLGYLPLDAMLWKRAGAHCRAYWDNHKAPVMAAFKVRAIDGLEWIYNDKLLRVLEEQSGKYYRKKNGSLISPVLSEVDLGKRASICELHPESGLTPWATCWECYAIRNGSGNEDKGIDCATNSSEVGKDCDGK